MSVKKLEPQSLSIDPAVETAMSTRPQDPVYGRMNQMAKARGLTPAQRRRKMKEAERTRIMVDCSPDIVQALDGIAAALGNVSRSQVVEYLLVLVLRLTARGEIAPDQWEKTVSRSMRFPWNLVVPELLPEEIEQLNSLGYSQK